MNGLRVFYPALRFESTERLVVFVEKRAPLGEEGREGGKGGRGRISIRKSPHRGADTVHETIFANLDTSFRKPSARAHLNELPFPSHPPPNDKHPPLLHLPDVLRRGGTWDAQVLMHVLPQIIEDMVTVAIFVRVESAVQVKQKDLPSIGPASSCYDCCCCRRRR